MNRTIQISIGILAVLFGASGLDAQARSAAARKQPASVQAYASVDECIILKVLDEPSCRTAFANARAEFEEKIPHFPTRGACEAFFAQCSIALAPALASGAPAASARADYAPTLERVRIVVGAAGEKRALPVTRANTVPVRFAARPLAQLLVEVSPKRSAIAHREWQAAMVASVRRANAAGVGTDAAPSLVDSEGATATDNPPSFPVSKQRWQQMQGAIGRIKQQQNTSTKP